MISQAWNQATFVQNNGTGADEEYRFKQRMVELLNSALIQQAKS
jgi:hypothetical protein